MAVTGSTSFADAAAKLTNHPAISSLTRRQLVVADVLMPYLFDAIESYTADGSAYPGGKVQNSLDVALAASIQVAAASEK